MEIRLTDNRNVSLTRFADDRLKIELHQRKHGILLRAKLARFQEMQRRVSLYAHYTTFRA